MPNSSTTMNEPINTDDGLIGDPDCPKCKGVGYLHFDYPIGHPDFGKLQVCTCRQRQLDRYIYQKLFAHSQLEELSHLTFDNFNSRGKNSYSLVLSQTVEQAYKATHKYAENLKGWLLLRGGFGCGKTHLAAALANFVAEMGVPTIFVTAPDLLDMLRFSFNDAETTFEQRFKDFREVKLLVLDDFGTHNATPWAQEKFFQIINHRYINKLPLVITTNLDLDEIDPRVRSRLQDETFVMDVEIQAPDYRLRGDVTSNPGLSILPLLKDKTFRNFEMRENELGAESKIRTTKKTYSNGVRKIETIVETTRISASDIKTLRRAVDACVAFAEEPKGWLVLLGQSGCGKTHLGAAIGNYRISAGAPAILVDIPDLMDYLRATFNSNVVSYQQRMSEVKRSPLLILDSFGKSQPSLWANEKLYQILNSRYYQELPTIIISHLTLEEMEQDYETIIGRFLDQDRCTVQAIHMPMYVSTSSKKRKRGRNLDL